MANYSISIPAPDDNISMMINDYLTITFVEHCRFCSTSSSGTPFEPALPNGPQDKDYVWTGKAVADSTIRHHSVGKEAQCDSNHKRSGNRSIQIGSGMLA